MALPSIQPYAMPTANEVPAARHPWVIDPSRAALLVHDMQNYFLSAYTRGTEPVETLIANIAALRETCNRLGIPVIFTGKEYQTPAQRGLELDLWGPGMSADPTEAAIIEDLAPGPDDIRLLKWRYSAFVDTGLVHHLDGRDQLIVTGVYAHIGVQLTAADAFMRDIRPFVVADALADFSSAHHHSALAWLASRCGTVVTTQGAVRALNAADETTAPDGTPPVQDRVTHAR